MSADLSVHKTKSVLWGRELPIIGLYDSQKNMIDEWRFSKTDNFRMKIHPLRILDSENEMESDMTRQRIRGFRLYVEFTISNIENRDLLIFLRQMWTAKYILLNPHDGTMKHPDKNSYDFEMLCASDFKPEYFDGRFIGHEITFLLKSLYLMSAPPEDVGIIRLIKADTLTSDGVESANRQTSVTYWGEKVFYGDWELTAEDLKYVAFWEQPEDSDELDPYGVIW